MNRAEAPAFQDIQTITLPVPEKVSGQGPEIIYINAGTQDVLRIECLFFAGTRFEDKHLSSFVTNQTIKEGTRSYSSEQIAERLDYYGAFLETENNKDTASVVLYCLSKHLESCLPVFKEILTEPLFPEKELDLFLRNNRQRYLVNCEKVDFLARMKFSEIIFGSDVPYGYFIKEKDYDELNREDIVGFFKSRYDLAGAVILVSGKITEKDKSLLESIFRVSSIKNSGKDQLQELKPSARKHHFMEKSGAVQSAIRIGRPLFNRRHPDYFHMLVVNTILGGYFGSRLMANIREDKGYTYGIGSSMASFHQSGMFFITTEVGADVTKDAISEIYKEIDRLREQPVGQDELELVRNYMLGVFMRSMDGPFALSDKFKTLIEYGLPDDYYQKFIESVNRVTPADIQKLAQTYLDPADMYQLVVGSVDPD